MGECTDESVRRGLATDRARIVPLIFNFKFEIWTPNHSHRLTSQKVKNANGIRSSMVK